MSDPGSVPSSVDAVGACVCDHVTEAVAQWCDCYLWEMCRAWREN